MNLMHVEKVVVNQVSERIVHGTMLPAKYRFFTKNRMILACGATSSMTTFTRTVLADPRKTYNYKMLSKHVLQLEVAH